MIEVDKETNEVLNRIRIKVSRGGALRLKSGHTLVRQYDRILELDSDQNEVWSKSGVSFGTMRR